MAAKKMKTSRPKGRSPKRPVRDLTAGKGIAAIRGGATDKVEAGNENVRRVK